MEPEKRPLIAGLALVIAMLVTIPFIYWTVTGQLGEILLASPLTSTIYVIALIVILWALRRILKTRLPAD